MQHDVFISYANWDKKYADAACHYIEQEGVRCFIAPRDIRPGADWATSINAAIAEAKVFVLILTPNSNTSDQVLREVNLAVKNRLEIITFKVENVALDKGLEYYIGISHWLDALTKPLEKHLKTLADCVKEHCPPEKNQTPASGDALVKAKSGKEGIAAKRKLRPVVKLAIIVSTTVLVLLALFLSLRYHDKSADEVSMTTNSDAVAPTSSPESRKTDNSTGNIADMNPMFLFSKNVQTGDNFISKDLSVYADPQVDGSVLIRSTQERTILRTIQTPLTYDALRPENSKEDYDRVNTVFSDDHQWLVIYSFHYAHLFSMSDATIDRELPIQGILQGVQFIGNSAKIGLWYTDADGDYPVNYPPIDFSDRALVVDPQDNRALMSRELGESYQFLGFTKDGAYAAGEQGEDYITLVNLSGGETLRNNDALSVCNENVDFLPFSKDGKYVSLYQEKLQAGCNSLDKQTDIEIKRCADGVTVLKLSYPQESGSSRFVENDWLIVSHDWLDSIYELNLGKAIYEITEFQNEFFAPFDFIPGTHALFALTDPNDDWGDLRVALYDAVSNKLTISNVPFEISTSSNSIITKDKAVFYYNDGDDGSLSCQFVHYKVTEDGNVEFED